MALVKHQLYNIVFTSVHSTIILISVITAFLLRNKQPVRSRGYAPYLAALAFFIVTFNNAFDATLTWQCYFRIMVGQPLYLIVWFLCLAMYLRLFLLQRLYVMRNTLSLSAKISQEKYENIAKNINRLSFVTRPITTVCMCLCMLIGYWIILIPYVSSTSLATNCPTPLLHPSNIIIAIGMISFTLCCIAITLFSALQYLVRTYKEREKYMEIQNAQPVVAEIEMEKSAEQKTSTKASSKDSGMITTSSELEKWYVSHDPLLIKWQIHFITLALVIFWPSFLLQRDNIYYFINPFYQLFLFVGYGSYIIFPSVVAMIWMRRKRLYLEENSRDEGMDLEFVHELKGDLHLRKLFRTYCKNEYSLENIAAWEAILRFKDRSGGEEQEEMAKRIYELYLVAHAPMQINTTHTVRQDVADRLLNKNIDSSMFDSLERETIKNMTDTWTRWAETKKYKAYKTQRLQIERTLLGE